MQETSPPGDFPSSNVPNSPVRVRRASEPPTAHDSSPVLIISPACKAPERRTHCQCRLLPRRPLKIRSLLRPEAKAAMSCQQPQPKHLPLFIHAVG